MTGERVSSLSTDPADHAVQAAPGAADDGVPSTPATPATNEGAAEAAPRQPVDLRLVALTADRSHLVLEDSAAQQFQIPVDERLAAALRTSSTTRDRARPGQLEIALESQLSPREIQARIRGGRSIDEVSLAAGISPERVERYARPVIAERTHVVEQAQRTPGRRASGGHAPALFDLVQRRLDDQRASSEAAEWDAWREDDEERWTVRLTYHAGGRARSACWSFDPRGGVLSAADDEARWLVDETGGARDEPAPGPVRRLSSVPVVDSGGEPTLADGTASRPDEVYDREAEEARTPRETLEPGLLPREAAAGRSGRRPAVPSWDDIMFGTRKRH